MRRTWLIAVLLGLSFVPSLLVHLGIDPAGAVPSPQAVARWIDQSPAGAVPFLALAQGLNLTLVWLAVWFAIARACGRREPDAWVIASVLPIVASFDTVHLIETWGNRTLAGGLAPWTFSRLALAGGLLAAATLARSRPRRALQWGLPGGAVALLIVLALAAWQLDGQLDTAGGDGLLARPLDGVAFLLFAATSLVAIHSANQGKRSLASLAVLLSALPQGLAELELLIAPVAEVSGSLVLVLYLRSLGYLSLLVGASLEYFETLRHDETAKVKLVSTQEHLTQKTLALQVTGEALEAQRAESHRMERLLRMLRNAVETLSVGVTITDTEGRIVYVNPAEAKIHGYRVDELVGESSAIFGRGLDSGVPPEDLAPGQPWAREQLNTTKSGEHLPVRLVSNWVVDEAEKREGLVTLCEDITERRRTEEALERREKILSAVGVAAERFLAEGEWEAGVSEVLEKLGEATSADLVSMVSLERPGEAATSEGFNYRWVAPSYDDPEAETTAWRRSVRSHVFARWAEMLDGGRTMSGSVSELPPNERSVLAERGIHSFAAVAIAVRHEVRGLLTLETRDDGRQWAAVELEALRAAARTLGAALDRQAKERALAASQEKYRELLESANDLIQSVSLDGRFEFVNRAWRETLGYRQEEVASLHLWDVVHPSFHRHCRDMLVHVMGEQELRRTEIVLVTKSGAEIAVEGNITRLTEGNETTATLGIFRDISERLRVDRLKSEFISTVSHELRTPLTSIIAALGLLQSGKLADQPERSRELLAVAHRNSNRLLQLINDLLDLQKLAAGKMTFDLKSVPLLGVIQEALRGIQVVADNRQVLLRSRTEGDGMCALADEARLIQVLNNLLSNAIKFSAAGGEVEVGAQQRGERVVLWVRDQGPGIPLEFQHRLFDQFTQLQSSGMRHGSGSGLGLSIVKRLVESMSGSVSCDSEPGKGATFFIELPAHPAERRDSPAIPPRSARTRHGFVQTRRAAADQSAPDGSANRREE